MRNLFCLMCIVLGFIFSFLFQTNSYGQQDSNQQINNLDGVELKQQALGLMKEGKFAQAYPLLKQFHESNPRDIEGQFVLGMAALELGNVDESISHFEDILQREPDLPRVRLELARAYTAKGKKQDARSEFRKVLETNPPQQVRDNINRFLAVLEEKNLNMRYSVGYLYDDNVNAGPSTNTISFFGLPFQLEPGAKRQSDSALMQNFTIDHRLPISSNMDIISTFGFRSVTYSRWSEFNTEEFVVTSGPSWRGERTLTRIPLLFDYSRLGSERYGMGYGLMPEIRYALTNKISLNLSTLGERKQYFSREDRTGYLWAVSPYLRFLLGNNSFIDIGYQHAWEETKEDFLDNETDTIYAGYFKEFADDLSFFVGPSISWNTYDGKEAAFTEARDDVRTRINANLSKKLSNDLELAVGYTYTYNDSNLDLYAFRRNQLTVQLSKSF